MKGASARSAGLAAALCAWGATCWAGLGLSTKFGMVTMENLLPGATINTREAANLPYVITNRSDVPLVVRIDVQQSPGDKGMAALGYEVIPDTSWVRLGRNDMQAGPGQDVATDVLLSIPDDDRYLGKKYQVNLHATAQGPGMLGVGLMSVLRFSVAARRPTAEELAQRKRVEEIGSVAFDLSPSDLVLDGAEPGTEAGVEKAFKQALKLSNPNDEPFLFEVRTSSAKEEEMGVVQGYEDAPDPGWLKVESERIKAEPNAIRKVGLTLALPKDESLRGRKLQFLVVGRVVGGAVALRRVTRVLVKVKP